MVIRSYSHGRTSFSAARLMVPLPKGNLVADQLELIREHAIPTLAEVVLILEDAHDALRFGEVAREHDRRAGVARDALLLANDGAGDDDDAAHGDDGETGAEKEREAEHRAAHVRLQRRNRRVEVRERWSAVE